MARSPEVTFATSVKWLDEDLGGVEVCRLVGAAEVTEVRRARVLKILVVENNILMCLCLCVCDVGFG